MRYYLLILLFIFYLFFFLRSYLLSKKLGKTIKAKNILLNLSIFCAGLTSFIFIIHLINPEIPVINFRIINYQLISIIGFILITIGLILSCIASLSLRNSWRIGIDQVDKTELIVDGIYRFSRNPYFLSYDLVLTGMFFSLVNLLIIIPALLTMILFHFMILKEEQYLLMIHGDQYLNYKKITRRYF